MKVLLFTLFLGVIMFNILNFTYFFDWLNLIGIIVKLIVPSKVIKEIEYNKIIRNNAEYKVHRKKWQMKFLIQPIVFGIVTFIIAIIFDNIILAYFFGVIITGVLYTVLIKKESAERKNIEQAIQGETVGNTGDGSKPLKKSDF